MAQLYTVKPNTVLIDQTGHPTRDLFLLLNYLNQFSNDFATLVISQVITNGVTNLAPSEDAVFDALALKADDAATTAALALKAALISPAFTTPSLGAATATSINFGGTTLSTYVQSTYTPSLTNTTNMAASTAYLTMYTRIGNQVFVAGKVNVDPTAGGNNTIMGMSLPIASDLAADEDLGGVAASMATTNTNVFSIYADATNNRATFQAFITNGNALDYTFQFQYLVK